MEIADGPLEAERGRVCGPDRGEAALRAGQADDQQLGGCRLGDEGEMHRLSVAPKPEQRRLAGGDAECSLAPHLRVDDDARPGAMRGDAGALVCEGREEAHRPPSSPLVIPAGARSAQSRDLGKRVQLWVPDISLTRNS